MIVGAYALSFAVFTTGLGAFARARTGSSAVARVLLFVAVLIVLAGPWLGAAIAGVFSSDFESSTLLFAAPSPSYAFVAVGHLRSGSPSAATAVVAAGAGAAFWALVGLALLGRAGSRCRAIVKAHDEAIARGDALLAAEDARAAAARRGGLGPPCPSSRTAG